MSCSLSINENLTAKYAKRIILKAEVGADERKDVRMYDPMDGGGRVTPGAKAESKAG